MSSDAGLWGSVSSDAELIAAVRSGDNGAFAQLYERHAPAAQAVARQYARSGSDAEDITSDAFAKVFAVIQGGGGPDEAFRAYLFTVVRRLAYATAQGAQRVQPTDDVATFESAYGPAGSVEEPALEGFERSVVARAYNSLPERWQAVLWYTEVEGLTAAQIGPLLGISANGVAALSYRAREGLREAYLQSHLAAPPTERCEGVADKLGAYVRGGLSARDTSAVEAHLEGCTGCQALVLELGDVNHGMRAVVAPLVLGIAGVGALGGLGGLGLGGALAGVGAGAGAAGAGASAPDGIPDAGTTANGGAQGAQGGAGAGGAGAGGASGAGAAAAAGSGGLGALAGLVAAAPVGVMVVAAAVALGAVGVAVAAGLGAFRGPDDPTSVVSPLAAGPEQPGGERSRPTPDTTPSPDPTSVPTTDPTSAPTTDPPSDDPGDDDDDPGGNDDDPGDDDDDPGGNDDDPGDDDDDPGDDDPTDPAPGTPELRFKGAPGDPVHLQHGAATTLDLSITNDGTGTVTDLAAQVTLPPGVTVQQTELAGAAGLTPAFQLTSAGLIGPAPAVATACFPGCALGELGPGETAGLSLDVTVEEWAAPDPGAAIGLVLTGTGLSATSLTYPVAVEASPARLVASVSPSDIPVERDGTVATVPITLENWGVTAASDVRVAVTLPDGVTWAPDSRAARAEWTCEDLSDPAAEQSIPGPDVECLAAAFPGRQSGTADGAPGTLALDLPVAASPNFVAGAVVVGVSAAAPVASVETKATLTATGDPEPVLDARALVRVGPERPRGSPGLADVRVVVELTADVGEVTPGVVLVDLPEGLAFGAGGPAQSVLEPGCEAVEVDGHTGACAVTLTPDAAAHFVFEVTGTPAHLEGLFAPGGAAALQLAVGDLVEPVAVTLLGRAL